MNSLMYSLCVIQKGLPKSFQTTMFVIIHYVCVHVSDELCVHVYDYSSNSITKIPGFTNTSKISYIYAFEEGRFILNCYIMPEDEWLIGPL